MDNNYTFETYINKAPINIHSIIKEADKNDYFEGSNVEKPKRLTPREMELQIQADRVIHSLNKSISILQLLTHLPFIISNKELIYSSFTKEEVDFIALVLNSYNISIGICTSNQANSLYESINRIKEDDNMDNRILSDPNLLQVCHLLSENLNILKAVEHNILINDLPLITRFTEEFKELRSVAEIKLYMSGTEEEEKDKELEQAFKSNKLLTDAIKDLQHQLNHQKEELSSELNEKLKTYNRYVNKLAQLEKQFQIGLKRNIYKCQTDIAKNIMESETRQSDLSKKLNTITSEYDMALKDHLVSEKTLRMNRNKTEKILQNLLERYDQIIGAKQFEYEELKKEYYEDMETIQNLEKKLEKQEVEYVTLMKEKEEEEERMFLEIANEILINRSAKVIQRAWRAFKERKSKRKGKKGKKAKTPSKRR